MEQVKLERDIVSVGHSYAYQVGTHYKSGPALRYPMSVISEGCHLNNALAFRYGDNLERSREQEVFYISTRKLSSPLTKVVRKSSYFWIRRMVEKYGNGAW